MSAPKNGSRFVFIGGYAWLDFINTQLVEENRVVDLLSTLDDLVDWLQRAEVLSQEEARAALEQWDGTPKGERVLQEAKRFREVLKNLAERLSERQLVEESMVEEINRVLASRRGYRRLVRQQDSFEMRFFAEIDEPIHILVPIAESASALLCDAKPSLVKKCDNPGCILFFYDATKNHARRWCSMDTCGNRTKVAAHYRRHRGSRNETQR